MVLRETLNNYRALVNNIDMILEMSGLRLNFIEKELGIDRGTFYYKRKKGKLSIDEIEKILRIVNVEQIEDKIMEELANKSKLSGLMNENESSQMWSKLAS